MDHSSQSDKPDSPTAVLPLSPPDSSGTIIPVSNQNISALRPDRRGGDPRISAESKAILRTIAFDESFIDELEAGVADDPSYETK